ncbi:unnamed protein product [marine sediment metagenome]|uniref:Terminase small subunit n=1 Tax=marine sediment metagenome TaxID=412755 RepID=X0SBK3_9ZZZZ
MSYRATLRELSGYIGLTEQRVSQLCTQGIIPRGEDKLVDLREGIAAYCDYIRNQKSDKVLDETTGLEFKNYGERDSYYKSEERRISLAQKMGQLYEQGDVEELFYGIIELTREALLIIPDVLERDADLTPKQLKVTQKFCDKKLKALAKEAKKLGGAQ